MSNINEAVMSVVRSGYRIGWAYILFSEELLEKMQELVEICQHSFLAEARINLVEAGLSDVIVWHLHTGQSMPHTGVQLVASKHDVWFDDLEEESEQQPFHTKPIAPDSLMRFLEESETTPAVVENSNSDDYEWLIEQADVARQ